MIGNISFTGIELLTAIGIGGIVLLAIIFGMRWYFRRAGKQDLTSKYKDKKWTSPLAARSKYPEVDVFRYSGTFFRLSMVAVLLIAIGAFNWTLTEQEEVVEAFAYDLEVDLEIEPPRSTEPPPPPPPPPPPVIEEVPDEIILEEDDMEFIDQSVTAESEVDAPPPVVEKPRDNVPPPPPPPPPPPEEEAEIFKVVEEMPRFPGCEEMSASIKEKQNCANRKLLEFLYEHIQYPPIARENNIDGTVVVQFVVDKKGNISSPSVLRDIGGGCGEEALRVVKLMNNLSSKWSPGKQRGRAVNVAFVLPVKFKLESL